MPIPIRLFYQRALQERFVGYRIAVFGDGYELLIATKQVSYLPKLIVLDVALPLLTGYETLVSLRVHRHWSVVPVILLVDGPDEQALGQANRLGAQGCFRKPTAWGAVGELVRLVHTYWQAVGQTPSFSEWN